MTKMELVVLLPFKRHPWMIGSQRGERCHFDKHVWVWGALWEFRCQWGWPVILGTRRFLWNAPNVPGASWETDNFKEASSFLWPFLSFPFFQASTSRKRLLEEELEDADTTKRLAVCAAVSWTVLRNMKETHFLELCCICFLVFVF